MTKRRTENIVMIVDSCPDVRASFGRIATYQQHRPALLTDHDQFFNQIKRNRTSISLTILEEDLTRIDSTADILNRMEKELEELLANTYTPTKHILHLIQEYQQIKILRSLFLAHFHGLPTMVTSTFLTKRLETLLDNYISLLQRNITNPILFINQDLASTYANNPENKHPNIIVTEKARNGFVNEARRMMNLRLYPTHARAVV